MIRRVAATMLLGSMMVVATATAASAGDPVETNILERVECLFRVYVTEGGEQGLDCLT